MTGLLKTLFGKKENGNQDMAAAGGQDVEASTTGTAGAMGSAESGAAESAAEPIHITDDTFDETVANSSMPVLVDFWAPWCGPCRMVAPVVEDLARAYDGRALMAKVNTDENVQIAGQLGIMGIPTLILFKDGQEIDRVVGYAPQRVLEEKLNAALN